MSKPLTAGAFVDEVKIRELHDALSQQLPPEPPMTWLLAENDKIENVSRYNNVNNLYGNVCNVGKAKNEIYYV